MASPQLGNVMQQYSCRCHNITIAAYDLDSTAKLATDYHRVFVGENGIHIKHHCLTLRTRDRAQESQASPNKLLQHLALSCLACRTPAYRVAQETSRRNEAREGPIIPTEDWIEQDTLLSKTGWIEVFVGPAGCLIGTDAIQDHLSSLQFSHTFSIALPSSDTPKPPSTERTAAAQPLQPPSYHDSTNHFPLHTPLLPSLPPLFHPPPFTPSHPAFLSLATFATEKSSNLRQQAEEETRAFAKAKLDALEQEETQLRKELEGIWRAYREGWKEVLDRVNEERRRLLPSKSDPSTPSSGSKSGAPMSIRDFSPMVRSHPQVERLSREVMSPSASLLSTSRIQTGTHLPTPTRSPAPEATMSESGARNSNSGGTHSVSTVPSSRANGTRDSASSPPSSPRSHDDVHYPGAFKRNMDTNVDFAKSVEWLQGQEELRRRFGGGEDDEPTNRARKRTSKNLGIGAVEPKSAPPTRQTDLAPAGQAQKSSSENAEPGQVDSGSISKAKRRVTFNVNPQEVVVIKTIRKQRSQPDAEVELFELDDLPLSEENQEAETQYSFKPVQPRAVVRTPSYKLRPNEGAFASHPASLPAHHPQFQTNGYPNWNGGSARRSVVLADALPMLSSSVPAGDRILPRRSLQMPTHEEQASPTSEQASPTSEPSSLNGKTTTTTTTASSTTTTREVRIPSAPTGRLSTIEYAEAELKTLLAASAPSHRHAWKEGGRAWEMFYQRAQDKKKVKGAIVEEESDDRASMMGVEDDSDDASSGDSVTDGTWHNPSRFASSLPVQIRPLATHYKPPLEAKTSLADRQGVLVPPLQATTTTTTNTTNTTSTTTTKNTAMTRHRYSRRNSAAAIRRATYAERDRTRSIDPGPTLDFNEQEEMEDEDEDEGGGGGALGSGGGGGDGALGGGGGDGERGRHHALSILQARSVIPEAGMWRSMTS